MTQSIPEIIRALREDHNYTQKEIAEQLGVAQQYYSKYEMGEYELPVRHIITLSKIYNVSTDYILGLTSTPTLIPNLDSPLCGTTTVGSMMSKLLSLSPESRRSVRDYVDFLVAQQFGK